MTEPNPIVKNLCKKHLLQRFPNIKSTECWSCYQCRTQNYPGIKGIPLIKKLQDEDEHLEFMGYVKRIEDKCNNITTDEDALSQGRPMKKSKIAGVELQNLKCETNLGVKPWGHREVRIQSSSTSSPSPPPPSPLPHVPPCPHTDRFSPRILESPSSRLLYLAYSAPVSLRVPPVVAYSHRGQPQYP